MRSGLIFLAVAQAALVAHLLAGVASAQTLDSASIQQSQADYDPFDGIDRDGRIPKIDRPSDINHPERWRYIPEGRRISDSSGFVVRESPITTTPGERSGS